MLRAIHLLETLLADLDAALMNSRMPEHVQDDGVKFIAPLQWAA